MNSMTRSIGVTFVVGLLLVITPATSQERHSVVPEQGFVPYAETAIAIAVAIWNPIYGKENIESQKPYLATLSNGKRSVTGWLHSDTGEPVVGGVAEILISKQTGCILHVSHGL